MNKRNSLKVQPLRRYKKPIYPSHEDKNPIDHPETMPYPFSHKAINALVAAGILVGVPFLSSDAMPSEIGNSYVPTIEQDSLVNPFPFKSLGVPYMPASFGTGLPSRLNSKEARELIDKVFLEEGVELEKNFVYDEDGVKVLLSGYDSECQIGYVWVDYYNMGEGMARRGMGEIMYENESETPEGLARMNKRKISATIRSIDWKLDRKGKRYDFQVFIDRFEKAKLIEDGTEKREALELINMDIHLEDIKYTKDKSEYYFFKEHLKEEGLAHKQAVQKAWHSQSDMLSTVNRLKKSKIENAKKLSEKIEQFGFDILAIKDETIRKEEFNTFRTFLRSYYSLKNSQEPEVLEEKYKAVLQFENKVDFLKHANEFMEFVADRKLSLEEAKAIQELGKKEGDFIASIGQRDRRFSYPSQVFRFDDSELQKLKELYEARSISSEEYKEALAKLKKEAREAPKVEALKKLEEQVRQYIQWAKQQGGH